MKNERKEKYDELESIIGDTEIVQYDGFVPNGNKIYVKKEFENPFGSHYDRVYLDLFRHHEEKGHISPGDKVLETSSGSAGVSFAGIGNILGYHCITAIPSGGEKAREKAILKHLKSESDLILTPKEDYVNGFPEFLKNYLSNNKDVFFMNHSTGPRDKTTGEFKENTITTNSLKPIATESLEKLSLDYFVPAIGNGSSIVGPSREFRKYGVEVIGYEAFQSAAALEMLSAGKYERDYGIKPGSMSRHQLPGTSYLGIDFPHLKIAVKECLDDIVLISDSYMDKEYMHITGRNDTKNLPSWEDVDFNDLGRSSRAGLATALEKSKEVSGKNFLIIGYDTKQRYDCRK